MLEDGTTWILDWLFRSPRTILAFVVGALVGAGIAHGVFALEPMDTLLVGLGAGLLAGVAVVAVDCLPSSGR